MGSNAAWRLAATPYCLGPAGYPPLHPRKWPWPQTRLRLRQRPRTAPFSAAHHRLDRRVGGSVVVAGGAINHLLQHHLCHSRESGNPASSEVTRYPWIPASAGMTVLLKTLRCYRTHSTTKPPIPPVPRPKGGGNEVTSPAWRGGRVGVLSWAMGDGLAQRRRAELPAPRGNREEQNPATAAHQKPSPTPPA